ncbi:hypothetical protein HDU89_006152 [Geranomyces variabilis]|nr:hypothetical protein HDU89_006152 [Geranomyces variabilis]
MNNWNKIEDQLRRSDSAMHPSLTRFHDLFLHLYRLRLLELAVKQEQESDGLRSATTSEDRNMTDGTSELATHYQNRYYESFHLDAISETDREAPMYAWCGASEQTTNVIGGLDFDKTVNMIQDVGNSFKRIVLSYSAMVGSTVEGLSSLEKKQHTKGSFALVYSVWITIALAVMRVAGTDEMTRIKKHADTKRAMEGPFWRTLETLMVAYMLEIGAADTIVTKEAISKELVTRSFDDLKKIIKDRGNAIDLLFISNQKRGTRQSEVTSLRRRLRGNLYQTSGAFATKYVLIRLNTCSYERQDSKAYGLDWDTTEVEHLLPASLYQPAEGWSGWASTKLIESAKNKLGNLLLLDAHQNKEVSNRPFLKKKDFYLTSARGPTQYAITLKRAGLATWTSADFDREQKDILEKLERLFPTNLLTPIQPSQTERGLGRQSKRNSTGEKVHEYLKRQLTDEASPSNQQQKLYSPSQTLESSLVMDPASSSNELEAEEEESEQEEFDEAELILKEREQIRRVEHELAKDLREHKEAGEKSKLCPEKCYTGPEESM